MDGWSDGVAPVGQTTWVCGDEMGFGFRDEKTLHGELDRAAIHVFRNGHCHSFGEAVCRLLPEADLIYAYDGDIDKGESMGHIVVRIDGRYLDASGWLDEHEEPIERDVKARWEGLRVIEPGEWEMISDGWLECRIDDAVPYAVLALQKAGVEIEPAAVRIAMMMAEEAR
jgi:hypothetical protein